MFLRYVGVLVIYWKKTLICHIVGSKKSADLFLIYKYMYVFMCFYLSVLRYICVCLIVCRSYYAIVTDILASLLEICFNAFWLITITSVVSTLNVYGKDLNEWVDALVPDYLCLWYSNSFLEYMLQRLLFVIKFFSARAKH